MKIYRSPKPDIDLPSIDILTLLFESNWCLAEENTNIHVEAARPENAITKAEARNLVHRISYLLRNRHGIGGHGRGNDIILTISSGNPFIPVVFYSIVAAGGVFTGTGTGVRLNELIRQIEDSDSRMLIVSEEFASLALEAAKHCGISSNNVLILDYSKPQSWTLLSSDGQDVLKLCNGQTLPWDKITSRRELQDTTIALLYSSGTTGLPKGVRLSQWSILASAVCTMDVAKRYKAQSKDFRFDTICHLPMANIAGIDLYSINPFYMGGTTYWMKKYDFQSFIEYHRRYRPAYQFTVPPVWLQIAKSQEVTDHFDGLHVAVTGSAPIGWPTAQAVRAKLGRGKAFFTQTWGTTETTGVITALGWRNNADESTWSVGELCPNVRLRIVDDDEQDVAPGQLGELWIEGDIMGQGYHKNSKATEEAFCDGFYRTGDIGLFKDGGVHIIDRKKELIKYKGNQVAPAELEALLTSHADIADAAVIGIWRAEEETEVPRAYIVKQPSAQSSLTSEEVARFVKDNVAHHKQLRGGVVFLDEIPKSPSGKILRKELRLSAQKDTVKAKL